MTPEQKEEYGDALHVACRKLRLAISILDADTEESPSDYLDAAMTIIRDVAEALRRSA